MAWKKRLKRAESVAITSAYFCGKASAKKKPNIPPSLSPRIATPAASAAARRPATSERVRAASASKKPGRAISRSVARPQAVATGLPESVPAW